MCNRPGVVGSHLIENTCSSVRKTWQKWQSCAATWRGKIATKTVGMETAMVIECGL